MKTGQAPVIHYMPELYRQLIIGEIDPTDIITHKLSLSEAAYGFKIFNNKEDDCIKVVLRP